MYTVDYAILGAGAIGSILGAHLARAGHSVAMLVRNERGQQLHRSGLQIRGLVEFATPVTVVTEHRQLRSAAVLIVATKTTGTEAALEALRAARIEVAFSIQNGLWKNDVLARTFGAERALGALANTSGELLPTGEVLFTRNVNLLIGELGGGYSERTQRIAAEIDAAGVRATAVPNILELEWTKFVGWVPLMSLAVLTRAVTWRYLREPHSATVIVKLYREVAALARALGVSLIDDHALLPQAAILRGTEAEAVEAVMNAGRVYHLNAPEHRMSAAQDLLAGRPLEVEETLGHAVRLAAQASVAAPMLETFYHLVSAVNRTR